MEHQTILTMRGIDKSFGGVSVLKQVDLTVETGSVHALLGENGAGKSTLMNILTGVYTADAGSVCFLEQDITGAPIHRTEAMGIAFVHQELNLFNDLTVYENIFFGKEMITPLGHLRKKEMIARCRQVFAELGVDIDPTVKVDSLSASEKQTLEIAKAIFFDAKLLILDEPTTALSNEEIDHLFSLVERLKEQGKAFIFISHKMPEIFRLCDRYTVLRNGEMIETGLIVDTTPLEVTGVMVGESFDSGELYRSRALGEEVLKLRDLSGPGFSHVELSVKRGEIVALTGLQASGAGEMLRSVFGDNPTFEGSVEVFGKPMHRHSIHRAMKSRIAFLPANRKENSVLPDLSILENMYLSEHTLSGARPVIRKGKETEKFAAQKSDLGIKAQSPDDPITALSGGNQQKVFFARWLNTEADILLMDNPTQGIDVGAKAEIYKLILTLAEQGKTVIFNSQEIPEIRHLADRLAVFYAGEIVKMLPHEEITEHTVMLYATNAIDLMEVEK